MTLPLSTENSKHLITSAESLLCVVLAFELMSQILNYNLLYETLYALSLIIFCAYLIYTYSADSQSISRQALLISGLLGLTIMSTAHFLNQIYFNQRAFIWPYSLLWLIIGANIPKGPVRRAVIAAFLGFSIIALQLNLNPNVYLFCSFLYITTAFSESRGLFILAYALMIAFGFFVLRCESALIAAAGVFFLNIRMSLILKLSFPIIAAILLLASNYYYPSSGFLHDRPEIFLKSIQLFMERPLFGNGLNIDIISQGIYHNPHSHNFVLSTAVRFGLVGLTGILCIVLGIIKNYRCYPLALQLTFQFYGIWCLLDDPFDSLIPVCLMTFCLSLYYNPAHPYSQTTNPNKTS